MKKRTTTSTRTKQIAAAGRRVMQVSRKRPLKPADLRRLMNLVFEDGFHTAELLAR